MVSSEHLSSWKKAEVPLPNKKDLGNTSNLSPYSQWLSPEKISKIEDTHRSVHPLYPVYYCVLATDLVCQLKVDVNHT